MTSSDPLSLHRRRLADIRSVVPSMELLLQRHRSSGASSSDGLARLRNAGIDLSTEQRLLRELLASTVSAPSESAPIPRGSVERTLEHMHRAIVAESIQDTHRQVEEKVAAMSSSSAALDWERRKKEILQAVGGISEPVNTRFDQAELHGQMAAVVAKVGKRETTQRLSSELAKAVGKFGEAGSKGLPEKFDIQDVQAMFEVMARLFGEDEREGGLGIDWFQANFMSVERQNSGDMSAQFVVTNAIKILADAFDQIIEFASVHHLPSSVNAFTSRGSRHRSRIASYAEAQVKMLNEFEHQDRHVRDRFPSGEPFWATIFFALRCGNKKAIVDTLNRAVDGSWFPAERSSLMSLSSFVQECHDDCMILDVNLFLDDKRSLTGLLETLIDDYYSRVRSSADADIYEILVYFLLTMPHPLSQLPATIRRHLPHYVYPSLDDYLWFRLRLVHENPQLPWIRGKQLQDHFTLKAFQDSLSKASLEKQEFPVQYLRVLLLSQNFDQAMIFVQDIEKEFPLSVYIGLCLFVHDVLGKSDPTALESLLYSIRDYLHRFSLNSPHLACWILYTIRMFQPPSTKERSHPVNDFLQSTAIDLLLAVSDDDLDDLVGTYGTMKDQFPNIVWYAAQTWKKNSKLYRRCYLLLTKFSRDSRSHEESLQIINCAMGRLVWVVAKRSQSLESVASALHAVTTEEFQDFPQLIKLAKEVASSEKMEGLTSPVERSICQLWGMYLFFYAIYKHDLGSAHQEFTSLLTQVFRDRVIQAKDIELKRAINLSWELENQVLDLLITSSQADNRSFYEEQRAQLDSARQEWMSRLEK